MPVSFASQGMGISSPSTSDWTQHSRARTGYNPRLPRPLPLERQSLSLLRVEELAAAQAMFEELAEVGAGAFVLLAATGELLIRRSH
jgi:hypothetical protein